MAKKKKVLEYRIIEDCSPARLTVYVNAAIKEGWRPVGGVSVTGSQFMGYTQALTRES